MRWLGIGITLGVGFMLAPYLVSAIWAVLQLLLVAIIASNTVWIWLGKCAVVIFAMLWFWSMATSQWNFKTWEDNQ